MASFRNILTSFGLAVFALALFACAEKSPEEKIADLRSRYTVEVNQSGFVATPRTPEPVAMEGEEAGEGEENGEMDADEVAEEMAADMAAAMAEPAGYDILLDLVVATSSREILPQLTIDVVHLDSAKREKNRWPVTLDTSSIVRGPGAQVTHKLEEVDYVEGDIFYAEVRPEVPAGERGSYPEFSSAAP